MASDGLGQVVSAVLLLFQQTYSIIADILQGILVHLYRGGSVVRRPKAYCKMEESRSFCS